MNWFLKAYNQRHPHIGAVALLLIGFGIVGLIILHWPV